MRIFVDADACPVVSQIESVAKWHGIPVTLYTDGNIDNLLTKRHAGQKARRASHKHHFKGSRKRTEQDNENFVECLDTLLGDANGNRATILGE